MVVVVVKMAEVGVLEVVRLTAFVVIAVVVLVVVAVT